MENDVLQLILSEIKEVKQGQHELKLEQQEMKKEISGMKQDISGIKQEISGMKQEINGIKQEISGMKQEINGIKQEIKEIKQEQQQMNIRIDKAEESHSRFEKEIKSDLNEIKTQQRENTDIIKALIHGGEFIKAEYDSLKIVLAKIEGNTRALHLKDEELSERIDSVEHVTQVNTYDIAKLRKVSG